MRDATQAAVLDAEVQGCKVSTHAMVIDEIGKDEDGRPIEVLFGALAMQQWGIRPVPDQETLACRTTRKSSSNSRGCSKR